MGIWVGKALVGRVSPRAMSIAGGILFLLFALVAALKAIPPEFLSMLSELIRIGT
jgi:putative Ca2+/H+ antiporter (TMEM165/GDT1 family)